MGPRPEKSSPSASSGPPRWQTLLAAGVSIVSGILFALAMAVVMFAAYGALR